MGGASAKLERPVFQTEQPGTVRLLKRYKLSEKAACWRFLDGCLIGSPVMCCCPDKLYKSWYLDVYENRIEQNEPAYGCCTVADNVQGASSIRASQ